MKKIDIESLNEFLKENGFEEEIQSNKEKLKILKKINFTLKVDRDFEELKYNQNKNEITQKEYIQNLQNLNIRMVQTQDYIVFIKYLKKEEKKAKMKALFKKQLIILNDRE